MSLINDALKRAKDAQQQTPPANLGGSPLRPVEPPPARGFNAWLMLVFTVVVAAASILLWQWFQQSRHARTVARNTVATVEPAPTETSPVVSPGKPPEAKPPATNPAPAETSTPARSVPAARPAEANVAPPAEPAVAPQPVTNPPAAPKPVVVAEAPPKPMPQKLQGIIFHPTRPSTVINGKLLFVGDRLGEWRVTVIEQDRVTLVSGSHTNVLKIE